MRTERAAAARAKHEVRKKREAGYYELARSHDWLVNRVEEAERLSRKRKQVERRKEADRCNAIVARNLADYRRREAIVAKQKKEAWAKEVAKLRPQIAKVVAFAERRAAELSITMKRKATEQGAEFWGESPLMTTSPPKQPELQPHPGARHAHLSLYSDPNRSAASPGPMPHGESPLGYAGAASPPGTPLDTSYREPAPGEAGSLATLESPSGHLLSAGRYSLVGEEADDMAYDGGGGGGGSDGGGGGGGGDGTSSGAGGRWSGSRQGSRQGSRPGTSSSSSRPRSTPGSSSPPPSPPCRWSSSSYA